MDKKEYISTIALSIALIYLDQYFTNIVLNVCTLVYIISTMNTYLEKFLFTFSIFMIIFSVIKII